MELGESLIYGDGFLEVLVLLHVYIFRAAWLGLIITDESESRMAPAGNLGVGKICNQDYEGQLVLTEFTYLFGRGDDATMHDINNAGARDSDINMDLTTVIA